MDTNGLPVTWLEGIGPATAARLAQIDVHTVADLVRANVAQVSAAAGNRVSVETAERWRAMALLAEMEGADNQLVEALGRAGVLTTEEVWLRDVADLVAIFQQAESAGIIPAAPALDAVHAMRLDAAVLHLTASLNGTVLDTDGAPVEGARVDIGDRVYTTDDNGRFRANRIAQGRPVQLLVRHDGFESLLIEDVPVLADDALIRVSTFTLEFPLVTGETAAAIHLCEWEGDRLPPISHEPMTTRAMGGPDTLREGDVLVLHRYYAGGDDAQLASKFLQYDEGRFVTLNWRVPVGRLPQAHALKQVFRYRNGNFKRLDLSPSSLRHLLALRRARNTRARGAPPSTPMEVDVTIGLMSDHFRSVLQGGDA